MCLDPMGLRGVIGFAWDETCFGIDVRLTKMNVEDILASQKGMKAVVGRGRVREN